MEDIEFAKKKQPIEIRMPVLCMVKQQPVHSDMKV